MVIQRVITALREINDHGNPHGLQPNSQSSVMLPFPIRFIPGKLMVQWACVMAAVSKLLEHQISGTPL